MKYSIRTATAADGDSIRALIPRLAAFEIPSRRRAEQLWQGDEATLLRWLAGDATDCSVRVAAGAGQKVLGMLMLRLGKELLSGQPSAHIEALAVARSAEGAGIGGALVADAEAQARARGALTITLHTFANNLRARRLYQRLGYDGEIIRYIKDLS